MGVNASTKNDQKFIEIYRNRLKQKLNDCYEYKKTEFEKYYKTLSVVKRNDNGIVRRVVRVNRLDRKDPLKSENDLPVFAVKTVYKYSEHSSLNNLIREKEMLKIVDHPYVLRFFDYIEEQYSIHFVTELLEGSNLHQFVTQKGKLDEAQAASLVCKILKGLNYLHTHYIIHRDIKPENIMVSGDLEQLKIIDFGLSRFILPKEKVTCRVGTPLYMAPEVVAKKYGLKCDLWSLGVLTYFLVTGNYPFKCSRKHEEGVNRDIDSIVWEGISCDLKDFIKGLLQPKPSKRFSAEQALSHVWLDFSNFPASIPIKETSNILNYRAKNVFLEETLQLLVKTLPQTKLRTLTEAFFCLEEASKGYVNVSNLKKYLLNFCSSSKKAMNKDLKMNRVYFSEFLTMNFKEAADDQSLEIVFKLYDYDNDGYLSLDDLEWYFNSVGKSLQHTELFEVFGENSLYDKVDFGQFKTIINNLISQ